MGTHVSPALAAARTYKQHAELEHYINAPRDEVENPLVALVPLRKTEVIPQGLPKRCLPNLTNFFSFFIIEIPRG